MGELSHGKSASVTEPSAPATGGPVSLLGSSGDSPQRVTGSNETDNFKQQGGINHG
jgi:hypothetical protein